MKSISNRMKRRVKLFGEKAMWMWFCVFQWILECMECGEDWMWSNVSVNVESLYSTLEIIQQGKKEGRKDVLVRNYPLRCKNPATHWELIQWSRCWFAWWNRNCWIGWRWLVVCLDYGDSTGSREWSHLIGWMVGKWNDGGKVWIWMSEEIGFDVAWFRCNFYCLSFNSLFLDKSDFVHFAW